MDDINHGLHRPIQIMNLPIYSCESSSPRSIESMDRSSMDRSSMDRSTVDHSTVDHSTVDYIDLLFSILRVGLSETPHQEPGNTPGTPGIHGSKTVSANPVTVIVFFSANPVIII